MEQEEYEFCIDQFMLSVLDDDSTTENFYELHIPSRIQKVVLLGLEENSDFRVTMGEGTNTTQPYYIGRKAIFFCLCAKPEIPWGYGNIMLILRNFPPKIQVDEEAKTLYLTQMKKNGVMKLGNLATVAVLKQGYRDSDNVLQFPIPDFETVRILLPLSTTTAKLQGVEERDGFVHTCKSWGEHTVENLDKDYLALGQRISYYRAYSSRTTIKRRPHYIPDIGENPFRPTRRNAARIAYQWPPRNSYGSEYLRLGACIRDKI